MSTKKWLVRWAAVLALFLGSVVALNAYYGSDNGVTTNGPSSSTVSHATLQGDANMTQQMSAPTAATGAPVHGDDPQLRRSQSSAYVRALEQHQADINRMLAQGAP